jgi:hypothetical protein
LEDGAVIEQVCIGVVSVNEKDFGNVSASRPPLDLYDHIERVSDVRFNRAIGEVHAALQNTTGETRETLLCRVGMDGGQRAGVPRVEKLQKIEGLASTNLPELRDGYVCSWCEIDRGRLMVIPHSHAHREVRIFDHPAEAEIVGRVTGVAMRIVGDRPPESKEPSREK